jgi:hypothetical protein
LSRLRTRRAPLSSLPLPPPSTSRPSSLLFHFNPIQYKLKLRWVVYGKDEYKEKHRTKARSKPNTVVVSWNYYFVRSILKRASIKGYAYQSNFPLCSLKFFKVDHIIIYVLHSLKMKKPISRLPVGEESVKLGQKLIKESKSPFCFMSLLTCYIAEGA